MSKCKRVVQRTILPLFFLFWTIWSMPSAKAQQTIYNSPYVTFAPDGKAWTTNAGDQDVNWYSEGTRVTVASMSEDEIESYISTEEPYDKAGAYGIQGTFARFIQGISGDYYNVMGLPVHRLYEQLKTW